MVYILKDKINKELEYDVYVYLDSKQLCPSIEITPEQEVTAEHIVSLLQSNYDVVFCSPQVNTPSFNDGMYLLPKLKDKGSTGYDVGIQISNVLDNVKRIPLGVKSSLPPDLSIEIKNRSGTFKKYEIMLTNAVGEVDSSYRGNLLAECIPIMYLQGKGQYNNTIPVLDQFDYSIPNTRIDYYQLKLMPVTTHVVEPIKRQGKIKVVGIVCQDIWDNFSTYFPSNRQGGFGSTDVVSEQLLDDHKQVDFTLDNSVGSGENSNFEVIVDNTINSVTTSIVDKVNESLLKNNDFEVVIDESNNSQGTIDNKFLSVDVSINLDSITQKSVTIPGINLVDDNSNKEVPKKDFDKSIDYNISKEEVQRITNSVTADPNVTIKSISISYDEFIATVSNQNSKSVQNNKREFLYSVVQRGTQEINYLLMFFDILNGIRIFHLQLEIMVGDDLALRFVLDRVNDWLLCLRDLPSYTEFLKYFDELKTLQYVVDF